jgi:hypothetical protein
MFVFQKVRHSITGYYNSVVKINFYFLFSVVRNLARLFSQPQAFNNVKLYNPVRVTVAFPNALGLPSVFTLKAPTLLKSTGELRLRSQPDLARGSDDVVQIPDSLNITGELHVA